MSLVNGISQKKVSKKVLYLFIDIIILCITSVLAVYLRFDFGVVPDVYLKNSYIYLVTDIILMIVIFDILKLYSSVWSYASVVEFLNVIVGCTLFEMSSYLYKIIFNIPMPRSYYLIQLMMMIILVGGTRFFYRIVKTIIIKIENKGKKINTMIIGAGSAGRLLIDEIENNKKGFNNKIICIIDDSISKRKSFIHDIPIIGGRNRIVDACDMYDIKEIIIAIPSASKSQISEIVTECQNTKCTIKILPQISELISNKKDLLNSVRALSYEDFLGRDQIVVDSIEIKENLKDKVILVTGGGGSIGSELCRQIAKCEPKKLVIFDIYENNAYDIQQELLRNYPNLSLIVIIGSVRDYAKLEKVFIKFNPDQIYHAAAHKHVPLMEISPNEAVKNNCLGTLNVAKLADIYKAKKFVLISTDKAVRPTNVMGATKRICEMIIQMYDKKSKNTDYVAVRFGNVLGSNGSVIPLFLKQIENGGPVTVTHKDITRFFMTIPEAVSLVLQAGCYAEGGEIFVLDMGKPVRIYDLAEKLIRFKGYEPNVDMNIVITGLRPGEKLYEEILMDEEGLKETPNKLIHIGSPIEIDKDFLSNLDVLIEDAMQNDALIKEKVANIVSTYKIDERRVD